MTASEFDPELAWDLGEWEGIGDGGLSREEIKSLAAFLGARGYGKPQPAAPLSLEDIIVGIKAQRPTLETLSRFAKKAEEFISADHQSAHRQAPSAERTDT